MAADEYPLSRSPRLVPTLTEVVTVDVAAESHAPSLVPRGVSEAAPSDAQTLLARLGPEFEQQLSQAIAGVLQAQLQGLGERVRDAVAAVVHEAVAKALGSDTPQADVGENP